MLYFRTCNVPEGGTSLACGGIDHRPSNNNMLNRSFEEAVATDVVKCDVLLGRATAIRRAYPDPKVPDYRYPFVTTTSTIPTTRTTVARPCASSVLGFALPAAGYAKDITARLQHGAMAATSTVQAAEDCALACVQYTAGPMCLSFQWSDSAQKCELYSTTLADLPGDLATDKLWQNKYV